MLISASSSVYCHLLYASTQGHTLHEIWTRGFVGAIKGKERLITKVNTSIGDMHAAITLFLLIPALPAHN